MDMLNRDDRIGAYLRSHTDDFVFDELSENYLKKAELTEVLTGVPVPIRKTELNSISTLAIARNMAFIMGCDPRFKYRENYIAFIMKFFDQRFAQGLIADGVEAAQRNEFEYACIQFRAAMVIDPSSIDAVYCYGRACKDVYENGEEEDLIARFKAESIEAFEEVTLRKPDFAESYYFLGYGYINLGLYVKAKLTWEEFVKLSGDEEKKKEIRERLALLKEPVEIEEGYNMILSGRMAEGAEILSKYTDSRFSDWWPLWYYLGVAHKGMNMAEEAIDDFLKVLRLSPSNTDTMKELVKLYEAAGDEEKAEKYPEEKELLQLAAGNFEELYRFLEKDANPDRKALLHSLSQKDYKDAKAEVLEDALIYAGQVRGTWEEDTYRNYLLCPRIYYEELTPYRAFIRGYFTDEQKEGFIKDPESIWRYIEQNIGYEPEFDYETICASPVGCLKLRQGNPLSRKILFAAICRTLGIPARLNRVTQEAEYLGSDGFRVPGKQQEAESEKAAGRKAGLTLQAEDGGKWIYFQTWTIGKLEGMRFATLDYEGLRFDGKECRLELEAGIYRLITTARMPNGNQHASQRIFAVKEGEEKEIFVSLREGSIEDMLVRNEIPEFEVTNSAGERQKTGDILKGADGVICFLEEGAEPTEHVLNELMERAGDWNAMTDSGVRLVFIVRDKEALSNKTVSRTLEKIPAVTVVYDPEGESAEPVARRMYVDPEKLPLLAVTRAGMTGIYASSGYNVGSVDLMLKILSLQENR